MSPSRKHPAVIDKETDQAPALFKIEAILAAAQDHACGREDTLYFLILAALDILKKDLIYPIENGGG